jgi:predicted O-methyltransferase YrrM
MIKIKSILKRIFLVAKSIFFLNHDNSYFLSRLNFFRLKHKVLRAEKNDFSFFNLHYNNSLALGPLQKDEAIFLHSLVRCINPKNVVEFGFNKGHSAFAILSALNIQSKFLTIDNNPDCKKIFDDRFKRRFLNSDLFIKDMTMVDFGLKFQLQSIDFVFFDAVHDFELNLKTYKNLKPYLSNECIIIIHDTGLWNLDFMTEIHYDILPKIKSKKIDEKLIAHQIDERKFANFLVQNEEYNTFHVHSITTLRHGITILHRQEKLLIL